MPPWALVTPASRGIGLELARRLLRTTNLPVVATVRSDLDQVRERILSAQDYPSGDVDKDKGRLVSRDEADLLSKPVDDHSRLHMLRLDVTDEASIRAAADTCADLFGKPAKSSSTSYLHLAFAVPGILHPEKSPAQVDAAAALDTFRVNALGPLLLIKHFSPFLPRKATSLTEDLEGLPSRATWATLSARVGSVSDNALGGWYSYRASKAAVNQITRTFDNSLKVSAGDNAIALALHPGTVRTGLSKEFWGNVAEGKLFSPEFAAAKLVEVVNGRSLKDRGRVWDWKGTEITP